MHAIRTVTRSLARANTRAFNNAATPALVHKLPDLGYDFNALEPTISTQIMQTHYTKHHAAYVTNLNNALAQYAEAEQRKDLRKQIQLQAAIRFNGGGHLNHSIFWTNLAPKSSGGGDDPTGDIANAINQQFGSFSNFKKIFSAAATTIQGSGWAWLGYNQQTGQLEIYTKPNQDPLTEAVPLLGLDVWEHAYYYLYGPARASYVEAIWNVINWANVQQRFTEAKKK